MWNRKNNLLQKSHLHNGEAELLLWPNDGEYKWEITQDDFSDDDNDPDDSLDFNIQNRNAETDQNNWLELIQRIFHFQYDRKKVRVTEKRAQLYAY